MIFASDLDRTLIHPYRTLPEARCPRGAGGRGLRGPAGHRLLADDARAARRAGGARRVRGRHDALAASAPARRADLGAGAEELGDLRQRGDAARPRRGRPRVEGAWWTSCAAARPRSAEATEAVQAAFGPATGGWLLRLRDCDERFLYAVCELVAAAEGLAAAASEAMRRSAGRPSCTAEALHAPAGLTKLRCVEYLVERLGVRASPAAGDSLLDAELLAAADRAGARVTPSSWRGRLFQTGCGSRTASTSMPPRRSRAKRSRRERGAQLDDGRSPNVGQHDQGPADLAGEAGRRRADEGPDGPRLGRDRQEGHVRPQKARDIDLDASCVVLDEARNETGPVVKKLRSDDDRSSTPATT